MYLNKLKIFTFIIISIFLATCFIFLETNLLEVFKYETILSFLIFLNAVKKGFIFVICDPICIAIPLI